MGDIGRHIVDFQPDFRFRLLGFLVKGIALLILQALQLPLGDDDLEFYLLPVPDGLHLDLLPRRSLGNGHAELLGVADPLAVVFDDHILGFQSGFGGWADFG